MRQRTLIPPPSIRTNLMRRELKFSRVVIDQLKKLEDESHEERIEMSVFRESSSHSAS